MDALRVYETSFLMMGPGQTPILAKTASATSSSGRSRVGNSVLGSPAGGGCREMRLSVPRLSWRGHREMRRMANPWRR